MRILHLIIALVMSISICVHAQNERVVKVTEGLSFYDIYNNGTTVKKYVLDTNMDKPPKASVLHASDNLLLLKGKQIPGIMMVDVLSGFLKVPVIFSGDSSDVYDLDFNIKLEKPSLAERKSMLEELGFEFTKTTFTVKVAEKK